MGEFDSIFENFLFRYRSITEQNIDALDNNRLYFSTPINDFNDPYDNLVFADSNKIVFDIISNIEYGMDAYLEGKKGKDSIETFIFSQQWDDSKQRSKILNDHKDRIYNIVDAIKKQLDIIVKLYAFLKYTILC